MKTLEIEIDGKRVQGRAALHQGRLWIHVEGETYVIEKSERRARGSKAGGSSVNPGEIHAPMPGKIIKVMVKPGDTVAANQVLLVMEAMKMEYTLKSAADGEVAELLCEPGQQVALGSLLVKLKLHIKTS